ncbi:forkhead box protein R1 [Pelmatolapia mariae]|uniref:forkhead box protein R1 n=1 Tax=Pelmatolapia mariae TaxID=158779 RepID=UPI003211E069
MTLQLKTKAQLFDLHCSVGLTDWDMDKELKLATTTDQLYHDDKVSDQYVVQRPSVRTSKRKDEFIWYDRTSDTFVKPNLWLLVNPSIACPIQYNEINADVGPVCEPAEKSQTGLLETRCPLTAELQVFSCHDAPLQGELLQSVSSEYTVKNDVISCQPVKSRRKARTIKPRDNKPLKPGCWPRPPVNYCILIALALKSSHTGSLKVQQIYNFTREHFPFFQTAPDGWKNTIRHNLCFNSSFRKTCNQLCRDGKRKSCFWHLTLDGQRRLKDEIHMLTGDYLKQLEKSMSHPAARPPPPCPPTPILPQRRGFRHWLELNISGDAPKRGIMVLINWSLNAIDTLFSTRSLGSGEPECPGGTFPAGYTMDGWHNWTVVCLAGLSIEDIEDIYLFEP